MGIGTEMLEEEVGLLFPEFRVKRMDLDTTRSKFSYERILQEFSDGAMEILVGTQMVAKGLDFGNVGLVGIIDLDSLMNYPDFRSYEKTLQLGIQVSGRAGRTEKRGKVLIQTRKPDHPVVQQIRQGQVENFYETELQERREYNYPPFSRLIRITLKNRDKDVVHEAAQILATNLRQFMGDRLLGPQEPLINRIRNEYIMEIWIKIERANQDREKIKRHILHHGEMLKNHKLFRNLKVSYNVDPY
jgi:primosomal protein N' (replication factor Y)